MGFSSREGAFFAPFLVSEREERDQEEEEEKRRRLCSHLEEETRLGKQRGWLAAVVMVVVESWYFTVAASYECFHMVKKNREV